MENGQVFMTSFGERWVLLVKSGFFLVEKDGFFIKKDGFILRGKRFQFLRNMKSLRGSKYYLYGESYR